MKTTLFGLNGPFTSIHTELPSQFMVSQLHYVCVCVNSFADNL